MIREVSLKSSHLNQASHAKSGGKNAWGRARASAKALRWRRCPQGDQEHGKWEVNFKSRWTHDLVGPYRSHYTGYIFILSELENCWV